MTGSIPRLAVDRFRSITEVLVATRELSERAVILGSGQPESLLDQSLLPAIRRRGGGGAVLADRGMMWIDLWIPASSALHRADPRGSLEVAGELWSSALTSFGGEAFAVANESLITQALEVCFAGVGHGEVLDQTGRKLVGLAAWRSREGSLLQGALYREMDESLPSQLSLSSRRREQLRRLVAEVSTDLASLGDASWARLRSDDVATRLAQAARNLLKDSERVEVQILPVALDR